MDPRVFVVKELGCPELSFLELFGLLKDKMVPSFVGAKKKNLKNYFLLLKKPISQTRILLLKTKQNKTKKKGLGTAHPCNPSYSGGRDQEDCGSAWANSSRDSILKKPFTKIEWLKM
jgi:hypothetical protein